MSATAKTPAPPSPAPIPHLVGLPDLAPMFEVQPATAHQWRNRGVLVAPDIMIAGTPIWRLSTILEWAASTNREVKHQPSVPAGMV